jgi:hypothetical protein
MILGFMVWWPVGLMVLAFMIGRGRMGCGYHSDRWQRTMERLQDKMERLRGRGDWWGYHSSSGNRAFDEYRTDTLKRLEDEQREFGTSWHACARPRTRRNSICSWRNGATARRSRLLSRPEPRCPSNSRPPGRSPRAAFRRRDDLDEVARSRRPTRVEVCGPGRW